MNWYEKRLANRSHTEPVAPATTPTPTPAPQPHYNRPDSATLDVNRCPECGSTNYLEFPTPGFSQKSYRCFECGYPVVQSGTGAVGGGKTDGTVHRATQVPSGGFNPKMIIGRVE